MDTRDRIARHLRQLAPHVRERQTGELLAAAIAEIDRLRLAITETLDENGHLADGENCTLIKLKMVMPNAKVSEGENGK